MRYLVISSLFLCLLLDSCAGNRTHLKLGTTSDGEVVEAEGSCPIVNDITSAKKCSLSEAQKAALEKVVGVFISARTRVEKAVAIDQNILAKTDGYVKKCEVVREWEKGGFYHTKIRALVPPRDVEAGLKKLLRSAVIGNPRVAVLINETKDDAQVSDSVAVRVLTEALLAKGFKIVERETLFQANVSSDSLKAVESGDVAAGINLAQALQAEVLISGSAKSSFSADQGLGGFVSYRGTVSVKAVKAGTGETIRSVSKTAGGVDINRDMAADKAIENAAMEAASYMTGELVDALSEKAGLSLTVKGLTEFSQLIELTRAVNAIPGIQDVYTRSYEAGNAVLDITTSAVSSSEVAASVERIAALKLKVSEIYQDSIKAELLPK